MARKSRSADEESTATSRAVFVCPQAQCSKVFSSGHALGGHQNAHRSERLFMTRLSKISEAEARKALLSIAPANYQAVAAPVAETGIFRDPTTPRVQPEVLRSRGGRGYGILKIKRTHQKRPYVRRGSNEETTRRLLTKDLLGGMAKNGAGSHEKTITDSFVRDSKGVEEGEEVTSKPKEELDLELKLAF